MVRTLAKLATALFYNPILYNSFISNKLISGSITPESIINTNDPRPLLKYFNIDHDRPGIWSHRRATHHILTDAQRKMFVDAHNQWRNRAALGHLTNGKKAEGMPRMYWDYELEAHAKLYGGRCNWTHSQPIGATKLSYKYGENLYTHQISPH